MTLYKVLIKGDCLCFFRVGCHIQERTGTAVHGVKYRALTFIRSIFVKRFFFVCLLTVLLAACTATPAAPTEVPTPRPTFTPRPPHPTPSEAELEISNPTQPIEVKAGSTFTITVRTAPFPDYHWEVAEALDPNIIAFIWKDHVADDAARIDSSGKDVWRFQAVGPGTTKITLGYYKGMESVSQIQYVYEIVVTE